MRSAALGEQLVSVYLTKPLPRLSLMAPVFFVTVKGSPAGSVRAPCVRAWAAAGRGGAASAAGVRRGVVFSSFTTISTTENSITW